MVLQSNVQNVKNVKTVVAYVRVSTSEQNIQRQEDTINAHYHVTKWFIDKLSGKDYTLQTELQNLLNFVREGDLVVVESLSRLSRNTKDLLNLIHQFEERKIDFISLKEHITFNKFNNTPIGKLMFHFVAAIAQFERENMKQRQREGIAIAKANGVYKGRRRIIKHPQFEQYYEKWIRKDNQYNLHHFAKDVHVSGGTLSRFIKEHKILLNQQKELKEFKDFQDLQYKELKEQNKEKELKEKDLQVLQVLQEKDQNNK